MFGSLETWCSISGTVEGESCRNILCSIHDMLMFLCSEKSGT